MLGQLQWMCILKQKIHHQDIMKVYDPKTQAYQTGHRHKFIKLREPQHVENIPDPGSYDPDHTLSSSLIHRYLTDIKLP